MDGKVDSGLLITRRSFCEALVSGFAGAWLPALSAAAAQNQKVSNILINGDFEQDLTVGWSLNTATSGKGLAYRSQVLVHSGKFSLRLFPNRNNVVSPGVADFEMVQLLPADPYRGKPVYVSGWLGAKAGGTALLRLVALSSSGVVTFRELTQDSSIHELAFKQDILDLPDDSGLILFYVSCSVKGPVGLVTFDDIFVSGDPIVTAWRLGQPDYGPPLPASVAVDAANIIRRIPQTLYGMNLEWVYNGQGILDPNTNRFDPALLALSQGLAPTLLRFPGGLFSNYYDWKNGVGPPQLRPISSPGPVGYTSTNSFGTDEALSLATILGARLIITTNALTGSAQDAADWVAYVNNGTRRVDYWEVGNEMHLRYPEDPTTLYKPGAPTIGLTPSEYGQRLVEYATAMRTVDPSIKIGADIEYNFAASAFRYFPNWAQVVLEKAAKHIDFVSVHNALSPGLSVDGGWDVRTVYAAFLSSPTLIKRALASLGNLIETAAGDKDGRIRIGVTEYGPLFETDPGSRFIDHVKTLGSALFVASVMKVLIEDPRVDIACAFKLLDASTQGWIGNRDRTYIPKAPYFALQMFTNHFGPLLISTNTRSPEYNTRTVGWAEAVQGVPYLDVVASLSDDQRTVYIIGVNKHFDRSIQASIHISSFYPEGSGTAWTLWGTAIDANTGTEGGDIAPQAVADPGGRFDQGGPDEISVNQSSISVSGSQFSYEFPARSVTALVISGDVNPGQAPVEAKNS